jgi:exonuclease VII large subunit
VIIKISINFRLSQLETLRFELNTRNAELQQKVVMLQTRSHEVLSQGLPADKDKIDELTKQLSELTSQGLAEDKTKISELAKQLEDSTKLVSKTKNQYGKKIKSLEKQLTALKKV